MDEMCSQPAVCDRGVQVDFIGKRKRAMWRAIKRIPDDPRVLQFSSAQAMIKMCNDVVRDLYADIQTSAAVNRRLYEGTFKLTD